MRIALFTETYLPYINGVVTHVKLLREGLEKLGVNHSHQVIEGRIGVRNAAEQRHLPFPDGRQVQLIHAGQTADLVQVKGG